MIWLLLLGGAAAAWAWRTGRRPAVRPGDVTAAVVALIALRMFGQGKLLLSALALAGSAAWFYRRQGRGASATMSVEEASRLLEVPPGADRATVQAAHRRLIRRVHPDAGGSAELARKVNAARDALLSELRHRG